MTKIIYSVIALALVSFGSAFAADLNKDDAATIAKDGVGIGPKKAEMIVAERTKGGAFKDWTDLQKRVKGFGVNTIEKNATTLTFGPTTAAPVATAPATAAPVPVAAPAAVPAR